MIITFELAFLKTLSTVFIVVELLVAHIDLEVPNENVPLNIFSTVAGNGRRYLGCAKLKGGNRETGDWKVGGYNLMLATLVEFRRGLNTILIYAHRGSLLC